MYLVLCLYFVWFVLCGCGGVWKLGERGKASPPPHPHGTLDLLHGLDDVKYLCAVTVRDLLIVDWNR